MTPSTTHDGSTFDDGGERDVDPVVGTEPVEDFRGGAGDASSDDPRDPPHDARPRSPRDANERLDPRVVVYWLVSGIVGWGVLAGIATIVTLAFRDELLGAQRWITVLVATVLGALLVWSLISPSMAYRRWRFSIDDELMQTRYGIVFHEEKSIPISRLQHVDLTRGPIERMFGLATLVVFTAGTEAASFRLPGLAVARAEDLRDRILIARGDDVI